MVWIISCWWLDTQFEVFRSLILSKPQFPRDWIVLHINCIVDCKLECFESRVKLFDWMRPAVPIRWYQVTAMPSVGIVEKVVCLLDDVSQTNTQSNPPNKLLYLDSPNLFTLSNWVFINSYIMKVQDRREQIFDRCFTCLFAQQLFL